MHTERETYQAHILNFSDLKPKNPVHTKVKKGRKRERISNRTKLSNTRSCKRCTTVREARNQLIYFFFFLLLNFVFEMH